VRENILTIIKAKTENYRGITWLISIIGCEDFVKMKLSIELKQKYTNKTDTKHD
jgi:hypothetical protein